LITNSAYYILSFFSAPPKTELT